MYIYILVLGLILFCVFCIVWKNELLKSLFFTVCFIITLWINIPCFVNISDLEKTNNLFMIPFNLNAKFGIFYILCANVLLVTMLFLQSKFTNKVEYTYKEIKRIYDDFGNDAVELYIIGKNLDFLYNDKFEKQTNRIIRLRNNCKLLCESTSNRQLLDLYKKVSKQGVEVKFYTQNDNITNLKGQIKTDQRGIKKAIFTTKINKKYLLLSVDNQFLVSTILERCIKVYGKLDVS